MSPRRNTLADLLLHGYVPPERPRNAFLDLCKPMPQHNALWDWRPKTEYVPGYYRTVPNGLFGHRLEWVPGYWRREG